MAKSRREEQLPHWLLHGILILMTVITVYPILWVLTIAFSGKQSLALVDLPANPTTADRLRAVLPWPGHVTASNFTSVMTDQPFSRWLVHSAI